MNKNYAFQSVYTFPLECDNFIDWVYEAKGDMIFEFEENLPKTLQNKFVDFLNDNIHKLDYVLHVKHNNGLISVSNDSLKFKPFVLIRGYGYLTGVGGLQLPHEKAVEIQDSLVEFIVDKIKDSNSKLECKI